MFLRVHLVILGFRFKTKWLQLTVLQLVKMFGPDFATFKCLVNQALKPKLIHKF